MQLKEADVIKAQKWIIALLVISLGINIKTGLDIYSMKNEFSRLKNSVYSMNSTVSGGVSGSIYQIEQALKKENSLVSEFQYDFVELKNKRAVFSLKLKPRVYNKGEKIFFMLKEGDKEPILIPAETTDEINYTAKINVSVFDSLEIDLVVESGDTKKTERLESISPSVEKYAADIHASPMGGSYRYLKGEESLFITNYEYGLYYDFPYHGKALTLKDVTFNIELNGKIIDKFSMKEDRKGRYQHYLKLAGYKIPFKVGDTVYFYVTAHDDNGFNYKAGLESWTMTSEGNISPEPNIFDQKEIY